MNIVFSRFTATSSYAQALIEYTVGGPAMLLWTGLLTMYNPGACGKAGMHPMQSAVTAGKPELHTVQTVVTAAA